MAPSKYSPSGLGTKTGFGVISALSSAPEDGLGGKYGSKVEEGLRGLSLVGGETGLLDIGVSGGFNVLDVTVPPVSVVA